MERETISIKDIQTRYRIKQSTAYKWRGFLRNAGMEESWENYNRINNREINLSDSSAMVPAQPQQAATVSTEQPQVSVEEPQAIPFGGLGISRERLLELNAEVQAETRIKSVLRQHYEQEEAARAADRATKLKEGVMSAAPESIISWVQSVAKTA